jgi:hypothetical protein
MSMPHTEALSKPSISLVVFVGIAALGCLVYGIYIAQNRSKWFQSSSITQGTIVDVYLKYLRHDKSGNKPLYFPTVVFNVNGQRFQTVAESGTEQSFYEGEKIEVRYNPTDPSQAKIGISDAPGVNPKVFYFLGIALSFLAVIMTV